MGESEAVIRVDGLGKRYMIDHDAARDRPATLRDALSGGVRSLGRRLLGRGPRGAATREEFWALRDVSFEVRRGEVVGIVGRNGAGKSTLLKVLSRITEPTTGRLEIDGRVASLLEVGTGFHAELTGRENVYLNGSILGMSRAEIGRKFDEIVAFAEVERFLDTPVKRYSSGMYMRLAFAVAAHLEPEVLIVDEVLAVGDAQFQKKCLGKMSDVAKEGRTILFVSHNLQAVTTLCSRVLHVHRGGVRGDGPPRDVIRAYLETKSDRAAEKVWAPHAAPGDHVARITAVRAIAVDGSVRSDHDIADPITLAMEITVFGADAVVDASLHLFNEERVCLFTTGASLATGGGSAVAPGRYRVHWRVPGHFLNDGWCYVSAYLVRNGNSLTAEARDVIAFESREYAPRDGWLGKVIGALRPRLETAVVRLAEETGPPNQPASAPTTEPHK